MVDYKAQGTRLSWLTQKTRIHTNTLMVDANDTYTHKHTHG